MLKNYQQVIFLYKDIYKNKIYNGKYIVYSCYTYTEFITT